VCLCVCLWVAQQRQFVPCIELPSWFFVTELVSAGSAVRRESLSTSIVQGKYSLQRVMYGLIYRMECSRMRVEISTYLEVYCFDNCVPSSFVVHTVSVQWGGGGGVSGGRAGGFAPLKRGNRGGKRNAFHVFGAPTGRWGGGGGGRLPVKRRGRYVTLQA